MDPDEKKSESRQVEQVVDVENNASLAFYQGLSIDEQAAIETALVRKLDLVRQRDLRS